MAVSTEKEVFLTIRLPRDLHDDLKKVAAANDRSKSAETRQALREYLDRVLREAAS